MNRTPITSFRDKYMFLSNFYPCTIQFDGATYHSTEAAFQAAKTLNPEERKPFQTMSADQAKKAGGPNGLCKKGVFHLRPDWDEVKDDIMRQLLRIKFSNPELRDRLVKLCNGPLVEGNTWHDNYWGNCTCPKCGGIQGQNKLGKMLMELRRSLSTQVLAEYDNHSMTDADIKARSTITAYYSYLVSRSAAEPQNEALYHEMDSIGHLFMGHCGDQYIVMAQEAAKRGFKSVVDIGCDRGWACHYFFAYDLDYTGIDCNTPPEIAPAPCDIRNLTYPTPIPSVMDYNKDTTVAVSSLCVGWFNPVEEQYAQLAKDFKYAMVNINSDYRHLAEKYFTVTHVDGDIYFMESRN